MSIVFEGTHALKTFPEVRRQALTFSRFKAAWSFPMSWKPLIRRKPSSAFVSA